MKKIIVLATAAFLFSGIAFSQTAQKSTSNTKSTKECCKKGAKCCKKDAKCCQKTTTQKKA